MPKCNKIFSVRVDSSGGSIGSDETGVQVTPNTEEWWPSQTLSAQLWIIWDQISDWNGSPKLKIPYGFNNNVFTAVVNVFCSKLKRLFYH